MVRHVAAIGLILTAGAAVAGPPATPADPAKVRLVIAQSLPQLNGSKLQVKVVEVGYGPGGSSEAHSHPCAVIGYVVEGSLRSQVKGGPDSVYRAGESFYEAPNAVHLVSANASTEKPVRFTATFICDSEGSLTIPAP
jgi:quercetin dioxygenase-like cupin family protein